jgi:hypothetical protein
MNILKNQLLAIKANLVAQKSQLANLQKDQKKNLENKQRFVQQLSEVNQKLSACTESEKQVYEAQKLRLVQEQKHETDREIDIKNHISSLDTNIQTINQQEIDCLIQLQKSLKNTFFAMRQILDQYTADPQPLTRFLLLQSLKDTVHKESLSPNDLDELKDRDYADAVLNRLKDTIDSSINSITAEDQKDLQNWKILLSAMPSVSKTIQSKENDLSSLPTLLDQTKKDLEQFQNQHKDGERKRIKHGRQASIAFGIAILMLIIAINLAFSLLSAGTILIVAIFPLFLSITAFLYGKSSADKRDKLDYTKNIQGAQKEYERLENDRVNMPSMKRGLEADKNLLFEQTKNLDEIYARHPELRNFQLP